MAPEQSSQRDLEVEIDPAPGELERRAIVAALERLLVTDDDGRLGAWWAGGLPDAESEL